MSAPSSESYTCVATIGPRGYRSEIRTGGHTMTADEPEPVDGTNQGPGPYDLLLASLGACKVMTMRMYADRKGWPLEGATVSLRHGRIHAKDCADCETEDGRIDEIHALVEVEGDSLSDEQRRRIIEISERCPVHRTLTGEIKIRTRAG